MHIKCHSGLAILICPDKYIKKIDYMIYLIILIMYHKYSDLYVYLVKPEIY